jgi:hypothetical protein
MSFKLAAAALAVLSLVACSAASEVEGDSSADELTAAASGSSTTYTCKMLEPIGIILDNEQGHSPAKLIISANQAKIVSPGSAMIASRKSSPGSHTVYEDFKPTDGTTGFFVADVTRLTIDTSMTRGGKTGRATFETQTFDDGEPTDPEISPPHKPQTLTNDQHMDCAKD